jgi:hypothetical protein
MRRVGDVDVDRDVDRTVAEPDEHLFDDLASPSVSNSWAAMTAKPRRASSFRSCRL